MIAAITGKMIGWGLAGAAAVGYAAYEFLGNKPPPLQSIRRVTPAGVPVQVVVPVTPQKPVLGQASTPIPASNPPTSQANYNTPDNVLPPRIITPGGGSTLKTVSTNQDVQSALNTLGFGPLTVDGNIGPLSQAAVKRFQMVHSLTVDGVPGPITKAALTSALAGMAATSSQIANAPEVVAASNAAQQGAAALQAVLDGIQSGSQAPIDVSNVMGIQEALNRLGASPTLTEDGVSGPMTIAAVKAFQIVHGLASDGVAGPMTKAALLSALNPVNLG